MESLNAPTISVIIPCWNDVEALRTTLGAMQSLHGIHETIVADISDTPDSRDIAASFRAKYVACAQPNRGTQMNEGAAAATGGVLLFHHADSVLLQAHVDSLRAAMAANGSIGGAFHRKFDARHPAFRWLEPIVRRLSARGATIYGDQSIFVCRSEFEKMRGYADIPLMEDVEFSKRLHRTGKVLLLDPPMESSARRHKRYGAMKISLLNGAMIFLYRVGVSPHVLHRWYYRWKP